MSSRFKKILSYALKISVSAAAIWYIVHHVGSEQLKESLLEVQFGYVVLALVLYLASQVISTKRLETFLRCISIPIPFRENLSLYFIGMAYNLFLPGGIGGDAYKVFYLSKKYEQGKKLIVQALLLDRLFGLLAIIILLAPITAYFSLTEFPNWMVIILILPLAAGSYFGVKWLFKTFLPAYVSATRYSIYLQAIQMFAAIFLAKGVGIDDLGHIALIFLLSSIATAIPVFLGGIGAREIVFAQMAIYFGFAETPFVTVAILFSFITLVSAVPGLFLDWQTRN